MSPNHNQSPLLDIDWHYDSSGYYSYIMLSARSGTVSNCVLRVRENLAERKITAQASGKSFRPADDGCQYEYYIRLGVTGENSEINFDSIRLILDEITTTKKKLDSSGLIHQELERSNEEVENLRSDLLNLQRKYNQTTNLLQGEITKAHKFRNKNDELSLQIAQLESERNQLLLKLNRESESYNEILVSIEEGRNKKIEELELDIHIKNEQNEQYQQEIDRLTRDIQQYKIEVEELHRKQRVSHNKFNKSEREKLFSNILLILLPKLDLDKGSIPFMLHEVSDYKFILKELLDLDQNPKDVASKSVGGKSGWLEITKVSDGDSNKGRIYYKKSNDTGKYDVRVRDKDTQSQDIKNL